MNLKELKKLVDEKIEQGYGEHELVSRGPKMLSKSAIVMQPFYCEPYGEEVILLVKIK